MTYSRATVRRRLSAIYPLTLRQRGAYYRLLDLSDDMRADIPDDEPMLRWLLGVSTYGWRTLRRELLEHGVITRTDAEPFPLIRVERFIPEGAKR